MTAEQAPRRRGRPPRKAADASIAETAPREPRGARRRRETRARLLGAAMRLMAERGMDAVAVNEITEAADVGFGSFYNHFSSKEAIHAALVELVFEEFADALDRALAEVSDPAEVLVASARHTLRRARSDRVWAKFLLREGLSARMLTQGLGVRLLRDLQRGVKASRFTVDDTLTAFLSLAGTVLAGLSAEVNYGADGEARLSPAQSRALKLPAADLPERIATEMLRTLGLPGAEARRIARLPLAELPASAIGTA